MDTLVVFGVVFVLQQVATVFELALGVTALYETLFVLGGSSVLSAPWTLLTSVYAHAGVGHLLSNTIALVIVGFVLERYTTRWRFHVFFVTTGAVAGLAQIWIGNVLNATAGTVLFGNAVLGASGAVLALYGYVLGGNRITDWIASRFGISAGAEWLLALLVAAILTYVTASPGVALIAHFTGVLIGVLAGRLDLLQPPATATTSQRNASYK